MWESLDALMKVHSYRKSQGIKDGNPVIFIDCNQCGYATAWMPWEDARTLANRWNRAHRS